jgi:hypothetical protein
VPPGEERAPHVRFDSALVALHPRKRLPFRRACAVSAASRMAARAHGKRIVCLMPLLLVASICCCSAATRVRRLTERIVVNHDTRIFRFALPSPEHVLGLPGARVRWRHAARLLTATDVSLLLTDLHVTGACAAGRHVFVSANIANHRVVRPYTPITPVRSTCCGGTAALLPDACLLSVAAVTDAAQPLLLTCIRLAVRL